MILAIVPRTDSDARWWRAAACATVFVAVSALLRLPFLHAPLTADEGGYAEVARLWSHGVDLYGQAWVDRPQGLLLIFRGALRLGLSSAVDLRFVAVVCGAMVVVLVIGVGSSLADRSTGLRAGLLVAVAGASPFIEGFTLAGELAAAVVAAAAIAALARFARQGRVSMLVLAGLLAGLAPMIKQSAIDAIAAGVVWLLVSRGSRGRAAVWIFPVAAAVPIASCVLASGDPAAWYRAVVAYGANATPSSLEQLRLLETSLPAAALSVGALIVLACIGWQWSPLLIKIWAVAAAIGVCLGGAFHAHYFLQLVTPLALLAAVGAGRLGRGAWAAAVVAAFASAVVAAPLWFMGGNAQAKALWPGDGHLQVDAAAASYVRAHTLRSQSIYVIWAAADLYYLADRTPAFRYLWMRNLQTIPGAVASADRLLAERVPALVVKAQPIASVGDPGRTSTILQRNYYAAARVGGDVIFRRRRG